MAKNKTVETSASVHEYIEAITENTKKEAFEKLVKLFTSVSGYPAKMWGQAIVGFGSYHYKYESGREGDAPIVALSSRAKSIVLYLGTSFEKRDELLKSLGHHKVSGGCVHIPDLKKIDLTVLKTIIHNSMEYTQKVHQVS